MTSELLINSAIGETRLALLEQGRAVEIRLFRDHEPSLVGAIFCGRVTALSREFQAAFVDLGGGVTGFLPLNLLPKRPGRKPADLTGLLHEGQKIITQVTADASGDKSVKLTGRVEIQSAALILHPFREGAFISSRIKDPARRAALKIFGASLDLKGMGLTLRTEAALLTEAEIKKTADHMIRHWTRAVENRDRQKAPFLLSQGPDSLLQILREYGGSRHERIVFDQPSRLKQARDWAREFAPDLLERMTLHGENSPLFDHYGVEAELDGLFDHQVSLASGGWITIEQTEAMTVIDVNMGDARLSNDPARQRLAINFAAAREIFRQIRLRGLGGIIVIDFINMSGKADVSNLMGVIDNLILQDPVQVQRGNLSAFGLLELTRKGRHKALNRQMLAPARPRATVETAALSLLRQAEQNAAAKPGLPLEVTATPDIARWLAAHPELLDQFIRRSGSPLRIRETLS